MSAFVCDVMYVFVTSNQLMGDAWEIEKEGRQSLFHCGSFLLTCLMHSSLSLVCCMCLSIEGIEFILTAASFSLPGSH